MGKPDFNYRIAETREEIEGAVRLVYRNYVELKYCHLNRFEVHFYLYDVLPETRTLVALDGDRVVATLTLVFDSSLGLPCGKVYAAELEDLRRQGRRLAEVSKLAVDRSLGARGLAVLKGLFRLGWLTAGRVRGATDLAIMVEPHHERFYARSLLFERAGELKPDPEAADAPSVLLRLRLEDGPERYRAAFGEEPKDANPYWYFCLAPEVPAIEAEARSVDGRLLDMNRRLETGRRMPNPTLSERRYVDYRLFSIAFVTDKTCREAERRAQKGLFAEEIEIYDRLLAALPPDYAPERRARIFLDMAMAAFYGALYERALELCRAVRQLALGADLKGESYQKAAMALHLMVRRNEAREEIHRGLDLPGLPALTRAWLLRTDGRLAVDRADLDLARRRIGEARTELIKLADSPEIRKLRATLAYDGFAVEHRAGDMSRARSELGTLAPLLAEAGSFLPYYEQGMADLAMAAGCPAEALDHARRGVALLDPRSNFNNISVLRTNCVQVLTSLGRLAEALEEAKPALDFARRSRNPGAVGYALWHWVEALIATDDLGGAEEVLALVQAELGSQAPRRSQAQFAGTGAMLAVARLRLDQARELAALAESRIDNEPFFRTNLRCLRVWVELKAGSARMAAELAEELPAPDRSPGNLAYDAEWRTLQLIMGAASGAFAESSGQLERVLDFHRAGGALFSMADNGLSVAESLVACGVAGRAPELMELCLRAAAEACAARQLPACRRRLRQLEGSAP